MTKEIESNLRASQLEMRGKLLSGFAHDIKNHFAIIGESNGLLEDYLAMGQIENPAIAEKIQLICDKIKSRLQLATIMSQQLSAFSHRTDTTKSTFDINDFLVEQLTFLERHARLMEINIVYKEKEDFTVTTDPSLLQFVLAKVFFLLLKHVNTCPKKTLTLTAERDGGHTTITLSDENGESCKPNADLLLDEVEELALTKLSAEVRLTANDEQREITLSLPLNVA